MPSFLTKYRGMLAARIFNPPSRCDRVVSIALAVLPRGNSSRYLSDRKLSASQCRPGRCGEEIDLLPLPVIEPQLLGLAACSLSSTVNGWYHCRQKPFNFSLHESGSINAGNLLSSRRNVSFSRRTLFIELTGYLVVDW